MTDKKDTTLLEKVSAMVEEQSLTKEQLITYLRQVMEVRALKIISRTS